MINSKFSVTRWNEEANGRMSEATVRKMYAPTENYRISPYKYAPGTKFRGRMRSGKCYILSGSCRINLAGSIQLSAGQIAQLPAGDFELEVQGREELQLILVWKLAP